MCMLRPGLELRLKVMPYGFKEELFKMLVAKMQHPLRMAKPK